MVMVSMGRLLSGHFKLLTFSFFLGFGLSACSGGSDEADEPVQADEATASDDSADKPSGDADDVENDADMPKDNVAEAEKSSATEDALPPSVVDKDSDTVNAELVTDKTPAQTPQGAPENLATPAEAMAPMQNEAAGMVSDDGKSVSSPGAAKFIKGKSEAKTGKVSNVQASNSGDTADYVIEPGDTLGKIAQKIYNSTKNWHSLAELNGLAAPYKIYPGDSIKYDLSNKQAKQFAKQFHQGMKVVTVKKGDTLSSLAQEVYGNSFSWKLFVSYNKSKLADPNHIQVGMKLSYADYGGMASTKKELKGTKVAQPKKAKVSNKATVNKNKNKKNSPISPANFSE